MPDRATPGILALRNTNKKLEPFHRCQSVGPTPISCSTV